MNVSGYANRFPVITAFDTSKLENFTNKSFRFIINYKTTTHPQTITTTTGDSRGFRVTIGSDNAILFMSGTKSARLSVDNNSILDIIAVYSSTNFISIYINNKLKGSFQSGVDFSTSGVDLLIGTLNKFAPKEPLDTAYIRAIQIFNFPLSPEQVSDLYNGGRYWEKKLWSEWYNFDENPILYKSDFTNSIDEWGVLGGSVSGYVINNFEEKLKIKCPSGETLSNRPCLFRRINSINNEFKCIVRFRVDALFPQVLDGFAFNGKYNDKRIIVDSNGYIEFTVFCNKKDSEQTYLNRLYLYFRTHSETEPYEFTISDFSVTQIGCTSEYLPSSITPTTWFDTSGNSNHIEFSSEPTILYNKPKMVINSGSAPNTVPEFVAQKWIHVDESTGKTYVYSAIGTASVADWKLIAND